ncbi:MAG: CopD family protein [Aestuariivirga sp.]
MKAAHLISVFAWMAGLFYLPRLLVYHSMTPVGGPVSEQLKIMERRLVVAILRPAIVASWFFGIMTAVSGGYFTRFEAWFWLKLALVAGLSVVHGMLERHVAIFAADGRPHGQRYFRIMNEIPTVILIAIVLLAVLRPF